MIENPYRANSSVAIVYDALAKLPQHEMVEWPQVYSALGELIPTSIVRSYLARMKAEGVVETITRVDKITKQLHVMRL